MQQDSAALTKEQQRDQNLEKLVKKIKNMGFGQMEPQVRQAIADGLAEFQTTTTIHIGPGTMMDVALHFAPGKNKPDEIFLNQQEALLTRPAP